MMRCGCCDCPGGSSCQLREVALLLQQKVVARCIWICSLLPMPVFPFLVTKAVVLLS